MIHITKTSDNTIYFSNGELVEFKEHGAEIKAVFTDSDKQTRCTEYYNSFFDFCVDLSDLISTINNK